MNKLPKSWFRWTKFEQAVAGTTIADYWPAMRDAAWQSIVTAAHGDVTAWSLAIEALRDGFARADAQLIEQSLHALHPWRKGPLDIGPVHIDTEWRSDWKWARFLKAGVDLRGQVVLDVGCGNGYYLTRMMEAGARAAIGIDPFWLYVMQWLAMDVAREEQPCIVLPLSLEELPATQECWDIIFSWGVLSHRRSPMDHLIDLRNRLRPRGTLCLETLVLQDAPGQVLVPRDRYAQMRNVWFVPDVGQLVEWLYRAGFQHVQVVDVSITTPDEQRSTGWMRFTSLADGLDEQNPRLTREGYPAPVRAMVIGSVTYL